MSRRLPRWRRRLTVAHASLKDLATPAQVATHFRRIVRRLGPHLATGTEAQAGDARAVKDLLGPTYNAARAGGRIFVWKTKRLRLMREPTWSRLTHAYDGDEAWRDLHVADADFEDLATDLRYRAIVPHLAAGVELGDHWNAANPRGVQVHEDGWPLLHALAVQAEAEGFIPIVLGDTNLNALRPTWRQYMARHMKEHRSAWETRLPRRGSHGRGRGRLIDNLFARTRVVRAGVAGLRRWKPMDHDVIYAVLDLTAAIRERSTTPKK